MPYKSYSQKIISSNGHVVVRKEGSKLVPFNRDLLAPTYYSYTMVHLLESTTGYEQKYPTLAAADWTYWREYTPDFTDACRGAYRRAYGRFKDKVYSQAALLSAVMERKATMEMVTKRLSQLYKGAKALKKGQFSKFMKTFGLKPNPKDKGRKWSRPKDFSSLWLEYWMGWAPTAGDIYTSLEFLGKPIKNSTVKVGHREAIDTVSKQGSVTTSISGYATVNIQATVRLSNPRLFTMEGLGLLNPMTAIWQVIPFSWLVGWFVNIEQCIAQVSDFLGLSLDRLMDSRKLDYISVWCCNNWNPGQSTVGAKIAVNSKHVVKFIREPLKVLPAIKPQVQIPFGLSKTRGATLASLLVQLFSPKGRQL